MKSAADIESNAIAARIPGGQDCASSREPESLHHLLRIRNLKLQKFFDAQGSSLQAIHPARFVHSQNVLVGRWLWLDKVPRIGEPFIDQLIADQPVFSRWKDVLAEI